MAAPTPEPAGHHDGVFGLCLEDDGLLLVRNERRVGGRSALVWDLPGGTVAPGEDLPAALRREWREETGLEATVGALRLVVDGRKVDRDGGPPVYTWRAFCFDVTSAGVPRPGNGIDAVERVPVAEACLRLSEPYHAPLRARLEGEERAYAAVTWLDEGGEPCAATAVGPLLRFAAAAAVGDQAVLATETERARADGVSPERLEEVLLQIVPYAGFPRAIDAFTVARPLLGPSRAPGVETDVVADAFEGVYAHTADRVRAGLTALHPLLARWTLGFAYDTVLARTVLPLLERELLAVAILTALGGLDDPLLGHMKAALRLGATKADLAAAIAAAPGGVGRVRRDAARPLLRRALGG